MKVHLCCGDVYLKGYVNVDAVGAKPPKGLKGTTVEKYYKGKNVGDATTVYADMIFDFNKEWAFPKESVSEFLMVSSFEHFTEKQASALVSRIFMSLKKGGKFRFDFPDVRRTALENYSDKDMIRLIYGSYKNDYCVHRWGYTTETIKDLLGNKWSSISYGDIVEHDYPMIGVVAVK